MDRVVLLLLLLCVAPLVRCYSSGEVMDSCLTLLPGHSGQSPQTKPAPFTVTMNSTSYRLGDKVKVTLQAPVNSIFTGFLLVAREVGGSSPVGSFSLIPANAQTLPCIKKPNSAVAHNSASPKNSIQVTWTPDTPGNAKSIQFHASFVRNFNTFWVGVTSPAMTFDNGVAGESTTLLTTTTTSQQFAPPSSDLQKTISSANCSVTKVCFSQPSNCDPANADCYFMSAMVASPTGEAIHYEMKGASDGYIAFGFSDDQKMGNDDIYICGIASNGMVGVQHAYSTGRSYPNILPLGNITNITTSVQNGVISCTFTSMNIISLQRTTGFNKAYYLMFVHGPSSNGKIQFHRETFISTKKINISNPEVVQDASVPTVFKAHGALMLISWMTLGSLGMMVARYLKKTTKGKKPLGKDVWFVVHVGVMSLTVAATLIAFIIIFSYEQQWSGGVHPVLGCLVMILSFLQPFMALLRCAPEHPRRFLFNWSHALNALVIKVLAVAAIFTGLQYLDNTTDQWLVKVMGGMVGWEALFFILLDVQSRCMVNRTDTLDVTVMTNESLLVALFFLGNFAFLVALLVGIGSS
ncbi:putative ferric-chelate reductase 1 [Etheostoma spectabile]|nr:putative ferric-chelate reductase 1 [Etheostoma spectabile]